MLSRGRVRIKTRSRKVRRLEVLGIVSVALIVITFGFLSFSREDYWIFVLVFVVLYELILSPVRNEENKTLVREHDRVIEVMRKLREEG